MATTLSWKPPLNSPGFLIKKQTFLYKHDGTALGNLATCYSLCDTNILHYELRHFRYWTPLSRPSLTHRLITWFLYIYKIFKKQCISLHIWLLKYAHALKEFKKRKENAVCSLKALFCFTADYKSRELRSSLYVRLAANKSKSIMQRIYIRGKKSLHMIALRLRENKKSAGLASSHSSEQM